MVAALVKEIRNKDEIKDHFALEALHSWLLMVDQESNVGHGNSKTWPDDSKNLICVRTSDEAYEELKGQLGWVFKQGLHLVNPKGKLVKSSEFLG